VERCSWLLLGQGWQFGKDILFTYGPLGFLAVPYYVSEGAGLRLLMDLALSFATGTGLCLVAFRLPLFWRFLLVGLLLFIAGNLDPRNDYVVNLACCPGAFSVSSRPAGNSPLLTPRFACSPRSWAWQKPPTSLPECSPSPRSPSTCSSRERGAPQPAYLWPLSWYFSWPGCPPARRR